MTKILRYVEIDIPTFAVTSPVVLTTFRFGQDTGYLPNSIDAIPSLIGVDISPAIISLGQNVGTRATVTASFKDHPYKFDGESFFTGTFWGKFRARYGLKLRGYALRVITGQLGDTIDGMETRNFIIESTDGPSQKGEFKIVAKDVLKFADGDRSQAPVLSNGFLAADINNSVTALTLSPAGIGDEEYPLGPGALAAIGGSEIVRFNRGSGGDVFNMARGINNTTAQAHTAGDRVQVCAQYTAQDPASIIYDLLVNYADVPAAFIDLPAWQNEIATYLNTVYTAVIAEPTAVSDLVSELIEQVGLVVWWDDITEMVKLLVLRPVAADADVFNEDNYLASSIQITEQPEKRLTQVYTYFGKINPLINADQINNYRSTSFIRDTAAEALYGTSVIKKIYSRWIPAGGRSVADSIGNLQLLRYRDPPRRIKFDVLRGSLSAPFLGAGYQIGGWMLQNTNGTPAQIPAQITSLNPRPDYFEVELEEIQAGSLAVANSPDNHIVIYDSNISNVNLRTTHDSLYGTPASGTTVTCTVNAGVIIGAGAPGTAAFNVGTWPAGITIVLNINGRIEGAGGFGGAGASSQFVGGATGGGGGTALFTRHTVTVTVTGGIWGGGGGGGGSGSSGDVGGGVPLNAGCGGSGGGGKIGGLAGPAGTGTNNGLPGNPGTLTAGGAAVSSFGNTGGAGGNPGNPGSAGGPGSAPLHSNGGLGGVAGNAIDGGSFVTFTTSPHGDIRGPQIN